MPIEIILEKGETIDKSLRRLKNKIDQENIIRTVKLKKFFRKPSEIKREKKKMKNFNNSIRLKREKK
jgi:ribosomal protein S21